VRRFFAVKVPCSVVGETVGEEAVPGRVRTTWPVAVATCVFWLKRISSAVSRSPLSTSLALPGFATSSPVA
jgi:hypothetical protein